MQYNALPRHSFRGGNALGLPTLSEPDLRCSLLQNLTQTLPRSRCRVTKKSAKKFCLSRPEAHSPLAIAARECGSRFVGEHFQRQDLRAVPMRSA
jgi:hypothetical protein